MKSIINTFFIIIAMTSGLISFTSCDNSFLKPKPMSFYTPENAFNSPEALASILFSCQDILRTEFIDRRSPINWEMFFGEICVDGTTSRGDLPQDMNAAITPDGNLLEIGWYWDEAFKAIKNANTVISRIDDVNNYQSDEQKNSILGEAYFHRAYWYYKLCNQFGDVPLVLEEVANPKLDFNSEKRDIILTQMKKDLEFSQIWVSDDVNKGSVTKGAISHLLTKVNLALGLFEDAIVSSSSIIDGGRYRLMTERFGKDVNDSEKNLTWDLHRPENKSLSANTEALLLTINRGNVIGEYTVNNGNLTMRSAVPNWYASINTPNGNKGTLDKAGIEIDLSSKYGRGTGVTRNTWYQQNLIWQIDNTDERHLPGNWVRMEDLVYNNTALKGVDPYYGKNLQLYADNGLLLCSDTIRAWYSWPHYKTYVEDFNNVPMMGGPTDWYVYRLAETYLLRTEAYFWVDRLDLAVADINKVRVRANAKPLIASDVNIGTILDERARELYYEEPRKTELTRISFILAKTGKAADNGEIYDLENFSLRNYYYDRIMKYTDFYNKGVINNYGTSYTLSPYHVLWPIPSTVINANIDGLIEQNYGY